MSAKIRKILQCCFDKLKKYYDFHVRKPCG